jgi:hypothetical protein
MKIKKRLLSLFLKKNNHPHFPIVGNTIFYRVEIGDKINDSIRRKRTDDSAPLHILCHILLSFFNNILCGNVPHDAKGL